MDMSAQINCTSLQDSDVELKIFIDFCKLLVSASIHVVLHMEKDCVGIELFQLSARQI